MWLSRKSLLCHFSHFPVEKKYLLVQPQWHAPVTSNAQSNAQCPIQPGSPLRNGERCIRSRWEQTGGTQVLCSTL
eukprot:12534930-Prorocentrum_lima.AAC.1